MLCLSRLRPLCDRLPECCFVICGPGKLASRPVEARSALNALQDLRISSPTVDADVFRIGTIIDSLVDTGAKRSVIDVSELKDTNTFEVRKSSASWIAIDQQLLPVLGEVKLSIRFQGAVVDLDNVLVMENLAHPSVLGADWVAKGDIGIRFSKGKWLVKRQPSQVHGLEAAPHCEIPNQVFASLNQQAIDEEDFNIAKLLFDPYDVSATNLPSPRKTNANEHILIGFMTDETNKSQVEFCDTLDLEKRTKFCNSLDDYTKRDIVRILGGHPGCFAKQKTGIDYGVHVIDTGESQPIRCFQRRVSETERMIISENVKKMLAAGLITPSRSPWNSPVVFVPNEDGKLAFLC